jgi:hypothetical protein
MRRAWGSVDGKEIMMLVVPLSDCCVIEALRVPYRNILDKAFNEHNIFI